ncbi:hypothetical protein MTR67_030276, partial [Solanum verrucosum]
NESSQIVYSYRNVLNGFAARLTLQEVAALKNSQGILSVRPRQIFHPQTTHTTIFLGIQQSKGSSGSLWEKSNYGKGMIIGVVDTGIMPDHPSFHDEGMPPPPARWKGKCEFYSRSSCNNKLIGARYFHESAGMAPLAHVAMYKVCSSIGCPETDVLAAIDAAIKDGVDVLSISISSKCASTTDRKLRATVRLGDGKEIYGESGFQPKDYSETMLPLDVRNVSDAFCSAESLENIDVKGKIVLCVSDGNTSRIGKGHYVKNAGGAGMILVNDELHGFTVSAEPHVVPAAHVSYTDGLKIISYMNSTSNPLATFLFRGTIFEDDFAREVASFSGRGPNRASPGILKPDIVAPGVNILAAWPTKSTLNIASGTSMSCPHEKSDLFATGAGHVNPSRASDPGLIYDIKHEDYVQYLCGLKYPNKAAYMSILRKVNCLSKIAEAELNYPLFSTGLG